MEFYRIDPQDAYSYQEEMEWLEANESPQESDDVDWREYEEWCDVVDENAVNREQEEAWQEEYAQTWDSLGY